MQQLPIFVNLAGRQVILVGDGEPAEAKARLVRAAGGVDSRSRQLYVTAQVQDPYARRSGEVPPLKVGTWVSADITGKTLKNVFVIPRVAIRDGNTVLVIGKDSKLRSRQVEIAWGERDHVIVRSGLEPGELLCTVSLQFAVEGTLVKPRIEPMPALTMPGRPAPAASGKS